MLSFTDPLVKKLGVELHLRLSLVQSTNPLLSKETMSGHSTAFGRSVSVVPCHCKRIFFGYCVDMKWAGFVSVGSWYIMWGIKAPQFWLNVIVQ
jgi:hypothetical protein